MIFGVSSSTGRDDGPLCDPADAHNPHRAPLAERPQRRHDRPAGLPLGHGRRGWRGRHRELPRRHCRPNSLCRAGHEDVRSTHAPRVCLAGYSMTLTRGPGDVFVVRPAPTASPTRRPITTAYPPPHTKHRHTPNTLLPAVSRHDLTVLDLRELTPNCADCARPTAEAATAATRSTGSLPATAARPGRLARWSVLDRLSEIRGGVE